MFAQYGGLRCFSSSFEFAVGAKSVRWQPRRSKSGGVILSWAFIFQAAMMPVNRSTFTRVKRGLEGASEKHPVLLCHFA